MKPKWHKKANQYAIIDGWNVFDDDGVDRIQRIDAPSWWRPDNCECNNTHEKAGSCCRPCWSAGFRSVPGEPEFADDTCAIAHVLEHARKNKHCRLAIKLVYGI